VRLEDLGWGDDLAAHYEPWSGRPDHAPARVAVEFNHLYRVYMGDGDVEAVVSGRLKHHAASRSELPAVGDWVVVRRRADEDRAAIVHVLPRRSLFSRKVAGAVTDQQVVAANVDVVFVVMALDGDFSPRRLERYLLLTRDSGAAPVVVLTKPDLCADLAVAVADVVTVAGALPVHVLNPRAGEGIDAVRAYVGHGRTCALLGSSGVGKSTIVNRLVGSDVRRTREVREGDSKGRHTTTHRELVPVPGGGLLLDTPGMRELQLWDVGDAVEQTFDDVERHAADCRFSDCRHRDEPRCAVKAAVAEGVLPAARLDSYLSLQDELAHLARQQDQKALLDQKRQGRIGARALRQSLRLKGR
jgi:ribosome biogenesis GTPase / thiamine phosphate phosphatase